VTRTPHAPLVLPTPFVMTASGGMSSSSTSGSDFGFLQQVAQADADRLQRRAHRRMLKSILHQ
jgi:hypothetical protein